MKLLKSDWLSAATIRMFILGCVTFVERGNDRNGVGSLDNRAFVMIFMQVPAVTTAFRAFYSETTSEFFE